MANLAFARNREDVDINPDAKALPASTGSTSTDSIDLGDVQRPGNVDIELEIGAPALDATELPNSETTTYKVEESSDDSSWSTLYDSVLVQTGAGGSGDDAATERVQLPSNVARYVRATATTSGSAGDQSNSTFTLKAKF